jgi:hypothetical protein
MSGSGQGDTQPLGTVVETIVILNTDATLSHDD